MIIGFLTAVIKKTGQNEAAENRQDEIDKKYFGKNRCGQVNIHDARLWLLESIQNIS